VGNGNPWSYHKKQAKKAREAMTADWQNHLEEEENGNSKKKHKKDRG